jgi:site-specific recombinase XerD
LWHKTGNQVQISFDENLSRPVNGYQPRLHDLRHTFAVHRLTTWYQNGADVQRLLPKLSVYLGHVNLAGTQVYLSMTPELLRAASQRFEQYAKGDQ